MYEFEYHLSDILEVKINLNIFLRKQTNKFQIEGVQSYSDAHFWQLKGDLNVASLHIQVSDTANAQLVRLKVGFILLCRRPPFKNSEIVDHFSKDFEENNTGD